MTPLPDLPEQDDGQSWNANTITAYSAIRDVYLHGYQLASQQDTDEPIRLKIAAQNIDAQASVLQGMYEAGLPEDWIHECTLSLALLREDLLKLANGATACDGEGVHHYQPFTTIHSGKPGRPRKVFDLQFLKETFSDHRNISINRLAKELKVHPNTLASYMKLYGVSRSFSQISDHELDQLIKDYRQERPTSGIWYVIGFLRRKGLRIQRHRVITAVKQVDRLGTVLRRQRVIQRRKYSVKRPNALWHCDGHHKLIHWGIVLHGFIDGYSRLIVALRASASNSSSQVLKVFHQAIQKYGTPSRVCGDRGGENVKVSVWMVMRRGMNWASFISTHNTRIERLWVEVGSQFVRQWRAFFLRLERQYHLNIHNPAHLWLLHFLFLDSINEDADNFVKDWNAHPLSTAGVSNQSPQDLFWVGQTTEGIYVSEHDEISPDVLAKYYGVHGRPKHRHPLQTGAGHPPAEDDGYHADQDDEVMQDADASVVSDTDEDEDTSEPLEQMIASNLQRNIRHAPVKVPRHQCPFDSNGLAVLAELIGEATMEGVIPPGYGLEEGFHWEPVEYIPLGRRKQLEVQLPEKTWKHRATLWVRAVEIMTHALED
ncbi:hypothetical protein FRC02_011448 [Tulasnella sp. 418]|nr:hypothetical protein FRC02_011448 [Tulasnella sp. 418]